VEVGRLMDSRRSVVRGTLEVDCWVVKEGLSTRRVLFNVSQRRLLCYCRGTRSEVCEKSHVVCFWNRTSTASDVEIIVGDFWASPSSRLFLEECHYGIYNKQGIYIYMNIFIIQRTRLNICPPEATNP